METGQWQVYHEPHGNEEKWYNGTGDVRKAPSRPMPEGHLTGDRYVVSSTQDNGSNWEHHIQNVATGEVVGTHRDRRRAEARAQALNTASLQDKKSYPGAVTKATHQAPRWSSGACPQSRGS